AGVAACGDAAFAAGTKFSISFFTMRLPSADPFTSLGLIPFSFAILRASGEAFTRESSSFTEGAAVSVSALVSGCSLLDAAFASDFAPPEEDFWFNNGVTSVPAGPTIAMISFTLAACPASTPIYNNVPSAYARSEERRVGKKSARQ